MAAWKSATVFALPEGTLGGLWGNHMALDRLGPTDVSGWAVGSVEPMGSKPDKLWLEAPPSGGQGDAEKWLFKPRTTQRGREGTFPKGDDWAEKLAFEIAFVLEIPAAVVEFATRDGVRGIISRDISRGRPLVLGNEVLFGQDSNYDRRGRRRVPGYTVAAVFHALRTLGVSAPPSQQGWDACSVFAGYMLLDALVANTDRHHENWGVLLAVAQPGSLPVIVG